MKRPMMMLALLLALGLVTSLAIAWAGALLDRRVWPDVLLARGATGTRAEMRGWLVERGHDATVTWTVFDALDLDMQPPEKGAEVDLPAWSVGHSLPDQPGPFVPLRERTRDGAWEVAAGWPLRCVRASRGLGPVEYALPGEFVRGGLVAMPYEWPIAHGSIPEYNEPTVEPWPPPGLAVMVPLRPMVGGLLVNTLVFAATWAVMLSPLVLPGMWRRRRRRKSGRCIHCGHSTQGLPEGSPCTECGRDVRERATVLAIVTGRGPMVGACLALLMMGSAVASLAVHRWMAVDRLPALHYAAAVGDVEGVERLVTAGAFASEPLAELNSIPKTMKGTTALDWTVSRGKRRASLGLIEMGAVLPDGSFATAPLVAAVIHGDMALAESLAARLPDSTPPGNLAIALPYAGGAMRHWVLERFEWDAARLDAAAHAAIEAHDFPLIELLIEAGLDPRRRAARPLVDSAIHEDARVFDGPYARDAGVIRALLDLGFDQTPGLVPRVLFEVLRTDNVPAFDALLNGITGPRGTRVFVQDGMLHIAAGLGHERMVRRLLAIGLGINATDERGYSALDEAIIFAQPGVVRMLLDGGADPRLDNRRHSDLTRAKVANRVHETTQSQDILTMLEAAKAEWNAREADDGG